MLDQDKQIKILDESNLKKNMKIKFCENDTENFINRNRLLSR